MPETLRETSTPATFDIKPEMSVNMLIPERLAENPESIFAERRIDGGPFTPITIRQLDEDVRATAKGFAARGLEPGDTVGIMCRTRYEWTVLDLAVLSLGGVVVPIYQTSSRDQVEWMTTDSNIHTIFVEDAEQYGVVAPLLETTQLEHLLVIDDGALDDLRNEGQGVDDETISTRASAVRSTDVATICYTSGTTGRPKGVELTHANLLAHVKNGTGDPGLGFVVTPVEDGAQKRVLLFLPLAHSYGRFVEFLGLASSSIIGYAPDTKKLIDDMQEFRPTWFIAVPRVFETVYNSADAKAGTGVTKRLFRWAVNAVQAYSLALDTAEGPSTLQTWRRTVALKLVLGRILDLMGGQLGFAISGGAALSNRHAHFFRGLGIELMEGYGATETTAPASVNRPGHIKLGSAGAPYPGIELRIADDGEILIGGASVFRGYHNNPEATAEALDAEGWFHSGDLGYIDADGYLHISGRRKEIIVTAGGKNVQPAVLENALRSHPLISEVMVVGEGKPFIGAMIALDEGMLPGWLANRGLPSLSLEQARVSPEVRDALQTAIDQANRKVSRAESIRKFTIVRRAFSEAEGEISASTKVIRRVVLEHFQDAMVELYGEG
ncbi:AMP-dependent synthetase/ligase [Gulosibacter molinativorax]|uniref:Acyl-CoA synthetase n=1 Tax=Gulosibacter molinativorax TaxID=256821 RepID=A0ABT7C3V8_9MICO|nr:AMP-dependent synthetase/ligase [Gulosibacter molinativorax]MDJ1369924.1 long-chain fatty acid--CoA ligase [Gulosibacter molinativorax]QUY61893.1 Long-chain-fatty-acid--CoA ligase [Gulosibacter molinativorax]